MTEAAPLPTDAAASTSASTSTASNDKTMAVPEKPKHYHQYCFHLSPTFNTYCPMRVRDLLRLDQYDAFEGQNIFFHLNHPIKWVRVCGVVVDVRNYSSRCVFALDDGSGTAIECVLPYERPEKQKKNSPANDTAIADSVAEKAEQASRLDALSAALVCKVVEVRGDIYVYETRAGARYLQIQTTKHKVLHSTQQEVAFWTKVNTFARDTLNKPWVLDKQVVRACRQEARNGIPQHSTAPYHHRSLNTGARSIQSSLPTPCGSPKKTTKWQIKPVVENDKPMEDTRVERRIPKKWQIKREQYDDRPVEETPEQEETELDDDATAASEEPEGPTSDTRRHTPRPEHMEVDMPARKQQPKRWRIR